MKFIKVTEANLDSRVLFLNTAFIGCIQVGNSTKDTFVKMSYSCPEKDGGRFRTEYYFVKETLEQIEELLNG